MFFLLYGGNFAKILLLLQGYIYLNWGALKLTYFFVRQFSIIIRWHSVAVCRLFAFIL